MLNEDLGKVDWINNLSINITEQLLDNGLNNMIIDVYNDYIDKIFISVINNNETTGKLINKDLGKDVIINLKINKDENLKDKIISILSHELLHFYEKIKKYNKNYKKYYDVRNLLQLNYQFKKNKIIDKFLKMFYLSLDEEINARVQQTYSEIFKLNKEEIIDFIKNYSLPFKDSIELINYDINELDELSNEEKDNLLKLVNYLFDYFKLKNKFTTFNQFKKFFTTKIKFSGQKLYRKILKLVGSIIVTKNVNENLNYLILFYQEELLTENFSQNFVDFDFSNWN